MDITSIITIVIVIAVLAFLVLSTETDDKTVSTKPATKPVSKPVIIAEKPKSPGLSQVERDIKMLNKPLFNAIEVFFLGIVVVLTGGLAIIFIIGMTFGRTAKRNNLRNDTLLRAIASR